jgi:tetratricopeptide (TPR) repeat protein
MRRIYHILCFLVLGCNLVFSQQDQDDPDKLFDDAEYFFASGDYQESLFLFLKLVKIQPDNANYNFRTGETCLKIPGQETKAIPYLEKAVMNTTMKYRSKDLNEKNAPHHSWFFLGNAYRINNDLDKALDCYTRFKSIKDFEKKYNIRIVDNEIKTCERAKIIKDSPLNLVKTNIGAPINTSAADYFPVLTPDENIIVYMNSQKFYEAIMYSKKNDSVWSTPVNITPQIGSDGDMRPTSLSADGTELFLVKKDNNNSDIYISQFDGNLWSKAAPLNKNINSRSNETFASLSPDGKNLYFTSNRNEGFGGLDTYVSKKQSVGDWGPAENLGSVINTDQDEETPYLSGDGKTLFFSSKGHFNMGGYDVFYSNLNKFNQFEEAINLGYPVNTTNDNSGYFPVNDGKTAYITLFDDIDLGKEDIYKLEILPFTAPKASDTPQFDKKFTITLINIEDNEKIQIIYDNKTDKFKVKSSDGKTFKVSVENK